LDISIVKVKPALLKPAEYNPRKAGEKEYFNLKTSIEEFGLVDPILVNSAENRKNIVIGGHFRRERTDCHRSIRWIRQYPDSM